MGAEWNFGSILGNEINQSKEVLEFYKKYMTGLDSKLILGYSKGWNLVAYALVNSLDDNVVAEVLNPQTLYWLNLTEGQREALLGDRFNCIVL